VEEALRGEEREGDYPPPPRNNNNNNVKEISSSMLTSSVNTLAACQLVLVV
jgi:hypothetical protein